jgi:hypothetical protein
VSGKVITLTAKEREDIQASKTTITMVLKKSEDEG